MLAIPSLISWFGILLGVSLKSMAFSDHKLKPASPIQIYVPLLLSFFFLFFWWMQTPYIAISLPLFLSEELKVNLSKIHIFCFASFCSPVFGGRARTTTTTLIFKDQAWPLLSTPTLNHPDMWPLAESHGWHQDFTSSGPVSTPLVPAPAGPF